MELSYMRDSAGYPDPLEACSSTSRMSGSTATPFPTFWKGRTARTAATVLDDGQRGLPSNLKGLLQHIRNVWEHRSSYKTIMNLKRRLTPCSRAACLGQRGRAVRACTCGQAAWPCPLTFQIRLLTARLSVACGPAQGD